mgnify:CR=1 FL=1
MLYRYVYIYEKKGKDIYVFDPKKNAYRLSDKTISHEVKKILKENGIDGILIGKDTRISGYMIESALESGFISAGIDVTLVGPMPTPGVAHLAKSTHQAGVVISASHNTFSDNGIKFFTKEIS